MTLAIQHMIRTFIAGLFAFLFVYYFHLEQGEWLIFSALLLTQLRFNGLLWENLFYFVIWSGLIAENIFLAHSVSGNPIFLAIYLSMTTFVTVHLGLLRSMWFFPTFLIKFAGILSGMVGTGEHGIVPRMQCVCWGVAIVFLLNLTVWPQRFVAALKQQIADGLLALNVLQLKTFLLYVKRDYANKQYLYEMTLHQQRAIIFSQLQRIRFLLNKNNRQDFQVMVNQISQLFEIFTALGNLRYRIPDHATFEVCENELKGISIAISHGLKGIVKKMSHPSSANVDLLALQGSIHAFEALYHHTLEIVTQSPVAFLIFMRNLNAVYEEMKLLKEDVNE